MPRPGRRALGLTVGSVLLFVIGTNNQAGWLLVMSSLLIGAVIAGMVFPLLTVRRVEVERWSPTEVFQGEEVRIEVRVRNQGRGPKLSLAVEDLHVRPATLWVGYLGPGEQATITTVRRATRRGVHQAEPFVVSSSAPFGVARSRRTVGADGRTVVYPRVVRLSQGPSTGRLRPAHEQSRPPWQRGGGQDFVAVREYRMGDSMRHVHWPSTARVGSLMVREFEREIPHRVGVLIDTRADIGVEETPLDLCCSAAASMAVASLDRAAIVHLLAARGESWTGIRPWIQARPSTGWQGSRPAAVCLCRRRSRTQLPYCANATRWCSRFRPGRRTAPVGFGRWCEEYSPWALEWSP